VLSNMITSYEIYKLYLESDKKSLNRKPTLKAYLFDDIWKFQKLMRKLEYFTNCKKNRLYRLYLAYSYRKMSVKLGFYIPINTFGPGLSIAHYGPIIINEGAKIGMNCRIHIGTNIGTSAGFSDQAPHIGDNCYIGPGAKLFGKINIGNNCVIGANAVVNKTFTEDSVTLGGIPAKIISQKSSNGLLTKGFCKSLGNI